MAFLLLAISPDDAFLNELRKDRLSKIYMPLWTYDELLALKVKAGEWGRQSAGGEHSCWLKAHFFPRSKCI